MHVIIRNKAAYTILFILIVSSFSIKSDCQEKTGEISLLFIGDIMGHDEQIWSAENRETHKFDYNEVFSYVKPVISEADIAIANFEVTLDGQPYMGYPQFSSPAELALACKNAGIDCLVTANNHSADRGKSGILNTIKRLDSLEIEHTGTFISSEMRDSLSPLIIRKNGASIALLNYTYGTNGIRVPEPVCVNMLDKEVITADIQKAKNRKADLIILFLHWGTEYDTVPSASQTNLADYFFKQGADLIIGSHPHVLQMMNRLSNDSTGREGIAVYSLGNFISNQRKAKTDGGSMVRIELEWNDNELKLRDAGYYLTWVYTPVVNYRKKFYILPCTEFENKPDFFKSQADYSLLKKFTTDSRTLLNEQNKSVDEIVYPGNFSLSGK